MSSSSPVTPTHVCVCTLTGSSLPASGTSAWDPGMGACLLTSPEVTFRAVTHSTPAPTRPCSGLEPPSLAARCRDWAICPGGLDPGCGPQVLAPVWLMGSHPGLSSPSGRWLLLPSCVHRPGKETINFCEEVSTPPLLQGFCLINLWSSSLSHPQPRPAGREFYHLAGGN